MSLSIDSKRPAGGLRELKKERTRQTILKVALDLFASRGYANTTLADIAAAAEISSGTLFTYFPSKESILFPEERRFYDDLKKQLESRTPEMNTFDVLRNVLAALEPPDKDFQLRLKIRREESAAIGTRPGSARVDQLFAESFARDLATTVDDLRVRVLTGATAAALVAIAEGFQSDPGASGDFEARVSMVQQMFDVLRAGLTDFKP